VSGRELISGAKLRLRHQADGDSKGENLTTNRNAYNGAHSQRPDRETFVFAQSVTGLD
jgi:hypothetical protein